MHILFLSRWFPYPPNNGSKLRVFNLLKGLATHHDITLLSFAEQGETWHVGDEICAVCQRVEVIPRRRFAPDGLRAKVGYFSMRPRSVVDTYSDAMVEHIRRAMTSDRYDVVIASQIGTAVYSDCFSSLPAIFEEVELGVLFEQYSRVESVYARLRHGLTWYKHRSYLNRLLGNFAACTVVSEPEKELVMRSIPGCRNIEIIPNCVDLADYEDIAEVPEPETLIFTGPFSYRPNYEAMVWFLQEVFPLIQEELPNVRLTITGDHGNLPLPAHRNVTLTGFVDDIRPLVARSWISLAPLWEGGGTRLKILEAMALQSAVVATPKGAEGLDVENGTHLLLADTPAAFAQSVIRVLRNHTLRNRLVDNACRLVGTKYDWKQTIPRFLELVQRTAAVG